MKYKGYEIVPSDRPGKAVRGYKKTNTIQVRSPFNADSYMLEKEFKYKADDILAKELAVKKAKQWVDKIAAQSE